METTIHYNTAMKPKLKEILYYNPNTNAVCVKKQLLVKTAENIIKALRGEKVETEWKEASVRLTEDDRFDIEVAYALCVLEITNGSKRARDKHLDKRYGSLLKNTVGYKTALVTLMLNASGMTYDEYKKHIRDITVESDRETIACLQGTKRPAPKEEDKSTSK